VAADPDNVRERLWLAVCALATGRESVQRRVGSAGIALAPLRPGDFADAEGRARFTGIMETLTALKPELDEGRIAATAERMSDAQAVALAEQIVELDAHYRTPFVTCMPT
jgi:hypothetical protein